MKSTAQLVLGLALAVSTSLLGAFEPDMERNGTPSDVVGGDPGDCNAVMWNESCDDTISGGCFGMNQAGCTVPCTGCNGTGTDEWYENMGSANYAEIYDIDDSDLDGCGKMSVGNLTCAWANNDCSCPAKNFGNADCPIMTLVEYNTDCIPSN